MIETQDDAQHHTEHAETLTDLGWPWLLGMFALIAGVAVFAATGNAGAQWGSFGLLVVTIFARIALAAHKGE